MHRYLLFTGAIILSCSCSERDDKSPNILGHWTLESIQYEDGSRREFTGDNGILFEETDLVELLGEEGKRRYSYTLTNDTVFVKVAGDEHRRKILSRSENELVLETGIGVYYLKR